MKSVRALASLTVRFGPFRSNGSGALGSDAVRKGKPSRAFRHSIRKEAQFLKARQAGDHKTLNRKAPGTRFRAQALRRRRLRARRAGGGTGRDVSVGRSRHHAGGARRSTGRISLLTPDQADAVHATRQHTLDRAVRGHPARFVNKSANTTRQANCSLDQSSTCNVNHPSLNGDPGCIKVVDTFRIIPRNL